MNNKDKNETIKNQNLTLKYLVWGLVCLIINILIDLVAMNYIKDIPVLYWVGAIFSKVCSTIGLALLIGCITNKIKATENMYSFMNINQKKDALEKIVSNGGELDEYKNQIINHCLELEDRYKTNVVYNVTIFKGADGKVCANTIMSYKEFRKNDFNEIVMGFDQPTSYIKEVKVHDPDNPNNIHTFHKEDIKEANRTANGSDLEYSKLCELPKEFKKKECLDFEKEFVFFGQDHWISYGVLFQSPMNGVDFILNTKDDLVIQEVTIFGENDTYFKTQNSSYLKLHSNKWLSHNNGFLIIISSTPLQNYNNSEGSNK